ncbi:hypothetical protein KP509_01G020700 [Ceratopteris richardii]|nr:hypothetical protein KP509_01G020700 [Ceratopteris richardii]
MLHGQIPDEIGDCSSLQYIDFSFNSITGDIPFSLSKLKDLEYFIMKSNDLTGPIPSTLSQLPNLKFLDLADNSLSGEIPSLIYWSEVLQYLGLRNNNITGRLSSEICRLTSLWYFDVRGNSLTGSIPENIGNCTSFQVLDLAFNQLTGGIPFNIGFLQVATLSLQGNQLSGIIPDVVGLMQALAVLDLSNNNFHGPIPKILGNLSYTGKLYLQGNKLTGSIPSQLGNMSKLQYLQLNDNLLTGWIPSELGKLQELWELNLSDNFLDGPIPENLTSCISLTSLNAHNNNLTGFIPPQLANMALLSKLNLSGNSLQGHIPQELGHILQLEKLDLSGNYLSGLVPLSIGRLEHLFELNLSRNKLSGAIPVEFGNLRGLVKMNLSFNDLHGVIPRELGQLQDLNILFLNNNELFGPIPEELANCLSLVALNLSFNKLSGDIPTTKNFTRFTAESYRGNKGLCGKKIGIFCDSHSAPSSDLRSKSLFIGLGLSIAICMIALLAWIWKTNYQQDKLTLKGGGKIGSGKVMHVLPKVIMLHMDLASHSYDDVMRLTDNLGQRYVIGFGASSTVYKCVLKSGKPIAVKKLFDQYHQNILEFEAELDTVGRIKHRNLVSLLGYSLSSHGSLLFYEFMQNGSLWDALHGDKRIKLDWSLRLNIALGAAKGLAYLHHDCDPRIVHRDIKTSNILLDESFEAHLTDFGIAKSIRLGNSHTSTLVMGTIGYIDPEYARTSRLNEKSDVYSFGVVLLELLTGRKAVDDETNLHQWVLKKYDSGLFMEIMDPVLKDSVRDLAALNKALQLALLCTKRHPAARPTMHDVVRVLQSLFPMVSPSKTSSQSGSIYPRYLDEYADSKNKENLNLTGSSSSTSGGHLFVKFGEVISQNTV